MTIPTVTVAWPATPDDVAALLRARTQDSEQGPDGSDVEVGAWTATTRPTLEEVERILGMCQAMVLGQTGGIEDLECATAGAVQVQAATMTALLAAMFVELSYFPEQVASARSAYDQYAALWSQFMPALVEAVAECRSGGVEATPGGEDGSAVVPAPSWAFPKDTGGMVGWQTRW